MMESLTVSFALILGLAALLFIIRLFVMDDICESLILIAVVDQDRQLVDALVYARALASQDVFGGITICYALGHHA